MSLIAKNAPRRKSLDSIPSPNQEMHNYLTADVNAHYRKASARPVNKVYLEDECMEVPGDRRLIFTRGPNIVRQSPIDIRVGDTVYDPQLAARPLKLDYPDKTQQPCFLQNTGHTWKVTVPDSRFKLTGGPLEGVYQLDQFHAHWGPQNVIGSEHMVDHYAYAAEIHFVHWNTSKCTIVNEAVSMPDGIAVLGVFLKLGKPHPEMHKLTALMEKIHYRGQETSLEEVSLTIRDLLPKDLTQYWTYDGSLTTTPFDDCVIWLVLKNHIEISSEQLNAMRSLVCHQEGEKPTTHGAHQHDYEGRMMENYRPVQEQTNSTVRSSFQPAFSGII